MASLFDPRKPKLKQKKRFLHIIILITSYVKKKISAVNFSKFRYAGFIRAGQNFQK
jgi:hypothetical protein